MYLLSKMQTAIQNLRKGGIDMFQKTCIAVRHVFRYVIYRFYTPIGISNT
jgi:hypothetical protein